MYRNDDCDDYNVGISDDADVVEEAVEVDWSTAIELSTGTIDGGEDGLLVDSDGVSEWSKNDGVLDDGNSVGLDDDVCDDDGNDDSSDEDDKEEEEFILTELPLLNT